MKCGKLSKYHKNELYPSEKHEILNIPLVLISQNKMDSSSKGVELTVCGLDHSGSQPFNLFCVG